MLLVTVVAHLHRLESQSHRSRFDDKGKCRTKTESNMYGKVDRLRRKNGEVREIEERKRTRHSLRLPRAGLSEHHLGSVGEERRKSN